MFNHKRLSPGSFVNYNRPQHPQKEAQKSLGLKSFRIEACIYAMKEIGYTTPRFFYCYYCMAGENIGLYDCQRNLFHVRLYQTLNMELWWQLSHKPISVAKATTKTTTKIHTNNKKSNNTAQQLSDLRAASTQGTRNHQPIPTKSFRPQLKRAKLPMCTTA